MFNGKLSKFLFRSFDLDLLSKTVGPANLVMTDVNVLDKMTEDDVGEE